MHTPELSDDELDALFRQGAERYPEELNLGAWSHMEQKLDQAAMQRAVNRKVARLFAAEVGVVAAALLLWLGYREYAAPSTPETVIQTAELARTQAAGSAQRGRSASANTAHVRARQRTSLQAQPQQAVAGELQASKTESAPTAADADGDAPLGQTPAAPRRGEAALSVASVPMPVPDVSRQSTTPSTAQRRTNNRRRQLTSAAIGATSTRFPTSEGAERRASEAKPARPLGTVASELNGNDATKTQVSGQVADQDQAGAAKGADGGQASGQHQTGTAGLSVATRDEAASLGVATSTSQPSAASSDSGTAAGASEVASVGRGVSQNLSGVGAAGEAFLAAPLAPVSAQVQSPTLTLPSAVVPVPTEAQRPRPSFLQNRFYLTVLYAPERSAVGTAARAGTGRSWGGLLEYRLTSRLRLGVGVLQSVKYYHARPADYTWAQPLAYPIDRVEAACRITDIPVNLRFDAWERGRNRLFAGAGLSSLLMRDEAYRYDYNYRGYPYSSDWRVRFGSNHFFSVVNLSAGYERQFTARFAGQVEPYYKLPLGGVGAGKVRLRSSGVFLGLKYGF